MGLGRLWSGNVRSANPYSTLAETRMAAPDKSFGQVTRTPGSPAPAPLRPYSRLVCTHAAHDRAGTQRSPTDQSTQTPIARTATNPCRTPRRERGGERQTVGAGRSWPSAPEADPNPKLDCCSWSAVRGRQYGVVPARDDDQSADREDCRTAHSSQVCVPGPYWLDAQRL
jgi:hypothetical protein